MAFKTDLSNANWNPISYSPEANSKYETLFLNILWAIRKALSPKRFSNESKGPPGTMDKQGFEKIV